ncbi:hypothetical protein POM88_000696 [Heracleum sosnowskyi]|uniref:Uncharacterized protein n=1 Tax=Heracleum sosnowskyi TaxID=360622 RepID=A0AAD8MAS9_9APIA|nr:hypothetical protein POM88_041475 [Heracleum sosnowskyi]KAK1401091.1 hypothetical protein POM88_000696 [Heracleum sosnowskyi]
MNVDVGFYPQFIIPFKPVHIESGKMELPLNFILEYGDKIPLNVILQFPTGRQIHVLFKRNEKSLVNLSGFIKEIIKVSGSIFIFSYKGEGIFSVHVLNDDSSEVEYVPLRTIPRYSKSGVGMKFLFSLNSHALEIGEMVVPNSFYKRFGMVIPALITFELWNGEVYHGNYVADEKKVIGLIEIIGLKNLQKRDIMLFTYVGTGRFELVIFDKFKVEKSFAINEAQSDAEVEIRAELPLQLEQNDISLKLEENEMSQEQTADDVEDEIMNELGINDEEMDHIVQEFTVLLTLSNVNHSSHGVVSLLP